MLASAKDVTGQVHTFNAFYSLYRGWAIVLGIETVFLAVLATIAFSAANLGMFLFSLTLTLLFASRQKRFSEYFKNKVLQTFLLVRKLEQTSEEK